MKLPKTTGVEIDCTTYGWGRHFSINESNVEPGIHKGWGHLSPPPKVGDVLLKKFEGAEGEYVGRCLVIEVEYPGDPADMFFATVGNIGPQVRETEEANGLR